MLMAEKEFTFSVILWEITSFSHSHRLELLVHVLARMVAAFLYRSHGFIWCDNVEMDIAGFV